MAGLASEKIQVIGYHKCLTAYRWQRADIAPAGVHDGQYPFNPFPFKVPS